MKLDSEGSECWSNPIEEQHFSGRERPVASRRRDQSEVLQLGNGKLANFEAFTAVKTEINELREEDVTEVLVQIDFVEGESRDI